MKQPSTPVRTIMQIAASQFALLCSLFFVSGCGDGKPDRVQVTGQVLFDGKPFTFGHIRFVPQKARQSVGQIDKNGRFKLGCFELDDGVVLGTHKIEVVVCEQVDELTTRWHAPKKYANYNTSGITKNITGPTDAITIELVKDNLKYPYVEKQK